MAMVDFLTNKDTENSEAASITSHFIKTTIRSLFFPSSSSITSEQESENDHKLKHISLEEVSDHDCSDDCWIIIYDRVYDVTNFLSKHPGGDNVFMEHAGRDCTIAFRGHSNDAAQLLKTYEIGILPPHERIYRWPGMIRISESKPE
ncbi:CLUMA_CG015833, isoform A [Clunio marinus]|uniref:CLUMA_CG015833, isoform A n=1 Tax=Clunio marinus TaxID=568069 RepID=A0A1J1IU87_9DIPT|nr:CLUMA_CG015833, isoform A [Clunio marinus]